MPQPQSLFLSLSIRVYKREPWEILIYRVKYSPLSMSYEVPVNWHLPVSLDSLPATSMPYVSEMPHHLWFPEHSPTISCICVFHVLFFASFSILSPCPSCSMWWTPFPLFYLHPNIISSLKPPLLSPLPSTPSTLYLDCTLIIVHIILYCVINLHICLHLKMSIFWD